MNFRHLLSIAGFVALSLVPSLRAADVAGDLVLTVDVPGGLGGAAVHDAVKAAAVGREYTIKEDKPDRITFSQMHHGQNVTFTAVFDAKTVKLYSDTYELDGSGARTKEAPPEKWVKFLHEDLTENLDKAVDPDVVGDLVWIIDVTGGLGAPKVHDVVKAAVLAREYTIKQDKPDHLTFNLTRNGHEANLAVVFDAKSVRLYSDSYELDSSGARRKKEFPHDWVKNLRRDFIAGFDQAAVPQK
jgi:hypothetical protein